LHGHYYNFELKRLKVKNQKSRLFVHRSNRL